MTVAPASTKPDFRLLLAADTLALPRNGKAKLKVTIERVNGFKEPVELTVDSLPAGVKAAKTTLAPNQNLTEIPLDAGPDAALDAFRAIVRGTASVSHVATLPAAKGLPEIDSVLVAVTIPTPFEVKADYRLSQAAWYRLPENLSSTAKALPALSRSRLPTVRPATCKA